MPRCVWSGQVWTCIRMCRHVHVRSRTSLEESILRMFMVSLSSSCFCWCHHLQKLSNSPFCSLLISDYVSLLLFALLVQGVIIDWAGVMPVFLFYNFSLNENQNKNQDISHKIQILASIERLKCPTGLASVVPQCIPVRAKQPEGFNSIYMPPVT